VSNLLKTLAHLFHPRRSNNHRARVLHPEALAYLILIVIGFGGLIQSVSFLPLGWGDVLGFASSITPNQVIEQTNQERQKVGLPPLVYNERLAQAALSKGQDMFSEQYWAHTSPAGKQPWAFIKDSGYTYRAAGENLARDFSNTDDMVRAWMASPTHRANIVNAKYQEIGIAVIDGELQGFETTLVVQMFGTPMAGAPQVAQAEEPVAVVNEVVPVEETAPLPVATETQPNTPTVLAQALVPQGSLTVPPFFSPLHLTKAFFLAVILLLIFTLIYDAFIISHRQTLRLVGKNLGHIIFLTIIGFLVILFKGGLVG